MSYEPSDKIGGLTDAEMRAFLAEPWNGRIATLTPDGWPHVTPVWYEFDAAARTFLVVGRERAEWVGHVRANPRVAFHVADDVRGSPAGPGTWGAQGSTDDLTAGRLPCYGSVLKPVRILEESGSC